MNKLDENAIRVADKNLKISEEAFKFYLSYEKIFMEAYHEFNRLAKYLSSLADDKPKGRKKIRAVQEDVMVTIFSMHHNFSIMEPFLIAATTNNVIFKELIEEGKAIQEEVDKCRTALKIS